jgi:hypothetical protein
VPGMGTQRAHYEPSAWWLTRECIGQNLRRYSLPQDLPIELPAAVWKLDTLETNRVAQRASSWLSKLDAIEGNQLLRACRTRLRAPGSFT